ncbi:MAG: ABC transporter substrate-binding protein [Hyphomicrobiaceae bacterium]
MRRMMTAAAAALVLGAGASGALAQAKVCDSPKQMDGFKTCADVAKAEAEGAFTLYSTDPEKGQVALLKGFTDAFPKIKTSYVRLQAGALYAKLLAERNAKSHLVDVLVISDMGMVQDFTRRKGFHQYVSPEMAAFKPEYKSKPEGFWTWGCIITSGIAYNPNNVKPEDAPKKWEDLLDPKFKDALNVKVSNSGLQMSAWYVLKPILGDEFFKKFAENKPRAFDSYVQQYGRLIDGQDKVIMAAQYSGFVEFKAKGAPLAFVAPDTGMPSAQQTAGIVSDAPHPNAAQLFMDWFLSAKGQQVYANVLFNHSAREDVQPPPNALPISKMKLLFPKDYDDFEKKRPEFVKEWDRIVGARK